VVERAPAPRTGGFAIDLRGAALVAAGAMGIIEACRRVRVRMREIVRVNRRGEVVWKSDGNFGGGEGQGGDVEILRDDLTVILQEAVPQGVEYRFGDSIASIAQDGAGVHVSFRAGEPRRFDLVIGADGLHSTVRALAFGPEAEFARPLGYYVGVFTMPNVLNLERQWLMSYLPGKMVNIVNYGRDKHTRGILIFASPPLSYDRADIAQQKALVANAFAADSCWETPAILKGMQAADDLYFDDVTQIHMKHWSNGRVALLGDAAYAPTLITGQGSSVAVVGAYVLAGELHAAGAIIASPSIGTRAGCATTSPAISGSSNAPS
jgi:2-polyprenyl-6-methoxyphenol hydroxylase-like FAD-dependent oxidoreductase